jgi:hypothetical protein
LYLTDIRWEVVESINLAQVREGLTVGCSNERSGSIKCVEVFD